MSEQDTNEDLKNEDGSDPEKGSLIARVNTVTRNWRSTERALEENNAKLEASEKTAKETGEYVKNLIASVEDIKKGQQTSTENNEVSKLEEVVNEIDDQIAEATKEEDWGKVTVLQGKARRADRNLYKAQNKPVDIDAIKKEVKADVSKGSEADNTAQETQRQLDNFSRDNEWYTNDNKMRRYADNLSHELANSGKYGDWPSLLKAIKTETEKEFDYQPQQSFGSVDAGSYGESNNNNNNSTKLTAGEKAMAHSMGISDKDFLAGKQLAGGTK